MKQNERKQVDTLKPKGIESGHNGSADIMANGQMVLGLQMASKVFILFMVWNLVNPICSFLKKKGRDPVKGINCIEGRGFSKKRMPVYNGLDRGSNFALILKDVDLLMVFYCMKGGKLLNVSISTISFQDKKLTDAQLFQKWKTIDWNQVEKSVNKLQTRITKAVLQNKWNHVKRLQYLLTHSYFAKLLAVRRVTQNKGKRTSGIDNEKWLTSSSKMTAVLILTGKGYKAKPLKRVFINKPGKKKKRPLGIPTMYDRAIQALYALALEPIAETMSDLRSFGFRKHRSTKDACQQIFLCLSRKNSAQWILEGDIKGCFDNINHQWLLTNIPMDKSIMTQFLKAGFITSGVRRVTNTPPLRSGMK